MAATTTTMTTTRKEHQKFMGPGINFKAKLVGIAEVAHPHGDEMCQQTLNSLKESAANARVQAKEHKKRIVINLTFEHGLRVLDERTKTTEFHHRMETVAFVCHDAEDERVFCYIASVGKGKHFLYAVKTAQPATACVNGIGELITAIMERKQMELSSNLLVDNPDQTSATTTTTTTTTTMTTTTKKPNEDEDRKVIHVKGRVPPSSSSSSSSSSESDSDEDLSKPPEEEDSHSEDEAPTASAPASASATTPDPPNQRGMESSGESRQVETFGVEIYIPKKSGSTPKARNRKKPTLDDDIAKYNYGLEFRAKLVGAEDLGSNVGDKMKMCEDALERLKAELVSTKEHKTRITVDVALEGIRVMEEKSRRLLYFHKVHQLVFIAFDVKEPRGCGYIAETEGKYLFLGLKSMERTSENLVSALQELIALSFEVKVQQLMKQKQKTIGDEVMIEEMKGRSASYRSVIGMPEAPAPSVEYEEPMGQRDPEEVKAQLEHLQELMDKGDALGEGYNNYEEKIQGHKQGKLNSSVLQRFGNKDKIDAVLGKVERVWFPGAAEDKLRVKWLVPQDGVADEFHVIIKPKPEGDAPFEYHVSATDPPDVTFFGLAPNTIYTVFVSAAHEGKTANPGVGSERTLAKRQTSLGED